MKIKLNIVFLLVLLMPAMLFAQRFAIISDIHGQTAATADVSILVKNWDPEFIICAGDNHYGFGSNLDDQVGQYYHDYICPYYGVHGPGDTINRYFSALGNHDLENGAIVNYLDFFTFPGNERYYDFVKGNIHFFFVNSNPDEPDGISDSSVQAAWLQSRLATSISSYNLVIFHHPPYSAGHHGCTPYMRWPLLQWGATTVFSGHNHSYQRILLNDFVYFVCPSGGGYVYPYSEPVAGTQFYDIINCGAILIEATIDSMSIKFKNTSDSLIDHYTIYAPITHLQENKGLAPMDIHIYPNPARKNIFLEITNSTSPLEIILYDIFGRMILKKNAGGNNMADVIYQDINVSELPNGLYVLHIQNKNSSFCKKIIIDN
ncbi:MAG TPA: metallophosphoesterase [Bacteroidales bacterium]|nr:metallophosphoesterase [Bacteroidales bacterium]